MSPNTKSWKELAKEKIKRQIDSGKKTAQQRIDLLLDQDSFQETGALVASPFLSEKIPTDGVISGFGTIDGRRVGLYAQDFTIKGGSLGKHHAEKICRTIDLAAKIGCPMIGIIDSGGARIDEGIHALGGYGEIFMRNVRYSGIIPQISIVLGPCAGGAVYSPALTDFIFTTKKISQMFITGPNVIKQVTHEEISKESLGGTESHAKKSGVVHFVADNEETCLHNVKKLLSYLPSNYLEDPWQELSKKQKTFYPAKHADEPSIPKETNKAYDIKKVIDSITDKSSFFEVHEAFAQNIVVGFARIEGTVVGIVANQPKHLAGSLDIDGSCKAARFINFCNSFSISILSLVDIPGFLPGVNQEHNGIIRHGAKLLSAYAEATVPKITVILRKAFGGAYIVMGSKHLGADFVYAWPDAQIAVLGAKGAVAILHKKEILAIKEEQKQSEFMKKKEKEYEETYLNPQIASEYGYIDGIIKPNETRKKIALALDICNEKVEVLPKKKAPNRPL